MKKYLIFFTIAAVLALSNHPSNMTSFLMDLVAFSIIMGLSWVVIEACKQVE